MKRAALALGVNLQVAARVVADEVLTTGGSHRVLRLAASLPGPGVGGRVIARRAVRRVLRTS